MSINFNTKPLKFLIITLFILFFSSSYILQAQNTSKKNATNIEHFMEENSDFSKDFFGDDNKINENFFINLLINLTAVFCILVFVYYPNYQKLDTLF
jgi:hypothetical protein